MRRTRVNHRNAHYKRNDSESVSVSSGEICPRNGEWEIIGVVGTTAVFSKDQIMPDYYGKKVVWMLVRKE